MIRGSDLGPEISLLSGRETHGVSTGRVISEHEVEQWATWLRAAGRPDTTIGLRTYHVRRIMREIEVDPWQLTTEQLVGYLAEQDWKPETRRAYRASLRAFYTWAQATGRRLDNPAALLPTVSLPRAVPRPTPDPIWREALATADPRTRLMLELAGKCGLRRGEVARVRREDVVPDLEGYSLHVKGKGGHERYVPLPDVTAARLLACPAGWIFPSPHRPGIHLTPHHVGKLISRLLGEGWTTHTLRHRCATVAYWDTKDIRAVQELLGHAKTDTTARYTKASTNSIRQAVAAAAA